VLFRFLSASRTHQEQSAALRQKLGFGSCEFCIIISFQMRDWKLVEHSTLGKTPAQALSQMS
jgi:hypothetical protein